MVIDSHHHFWKYDPAQYTWIDDSLAELKRDFLPADLESAMKPAGVDGVISVHARQSLEETHWLLKLAAEHKFIRGVVGWAPLAAEHARAHLETLCADPKLRGLRHVIHDEPDENFILRDDFSRGISLLKEFSLAFDLLIFERHLPAATRFVDRHPGQVFVLDHIGKPKIRASEVEPWARHMRDLARRPNVFCKISGMVSEADRAAWTPEQLRGYFNVALEAFGPDRLLAGSDWPVCNVACGYQRWWDILRQWSSEFSPEQREQFLGLNAVKAYKLG